jgi:hypothetical protein
MLYGQSHGLGSAAADKVKWLVLKSISNGQAPRDTVAVSEDDGGLVSHWLH